MASFGQLLKDLRIQAGLTQEDLAFAAGLSPRAISDLERGINQTPRRESARLLADALRLTDRALADFEAAARRHRATAGVAAATKALPMDTASFTGRETELALVEKTMADLRGAVGICAISGMAGVGKSALAVHAAHLLAPHFPDGQIYLQLHAHTPGQRLVDPADSLASLLQTIGIVAAQIPASIEARTALWRDHLAGRRILLVLDDAFDSEQVRPLLPGTAGCGVLVTSRKHLAALDDAFTISLDALPADEAKVLLVKLAGRAGVKADDAAVAEICRLCGYLPLALGLLARQLHHHAAWSAADLAADLAAAQDRLTLMHAEDLSVAAAFQLSYRDLSPGQQHLFRCLGLHPGTDIDAYAAAALAGISLAEAKAALEGLFDHCLLTEPARDRYRCHDLIREYARALAADDPVDERTMSAGRLLDYYLYVAAAANRELGRGDPPGASTVAEDRRPEHLPLVAGRSVAIAWLAAERLNLHAAAGFAAATGRPGHATAIPAVLGEFLRSQGHWDQAITLHQGAIEAAREAGARLALAQARALTDLGDMQYLTDDYPAAAENLAKALDLSAALDDELGEADAYRGLGAVRHACGEYSAADHNLAKALKLYQRLGDRHGEADALRELGALRQTCGDYQAAAATSQRALELYRDLGDGLGEADALSDLGAVQHARGDHAAAAASQQQALALYRTLGDRLGEANALTDLATVQLASDRAVAAGSLARALELFSELGDHSGQAEALNTMGELALGSGDPATARARHDEARSIAAKIALPREEARAFEGTGRSYLAEGQREAGRAALRQAREIYRRIGSAHAERVEAELDAAGS